MNTPILFNYAHRIAGLVVILLVVWLYSKVLSISHSERRLHIPAYLLLGSLLLQVVPGAVTIWSHKAPIPTTLHVACGAITPAACLWLVMDIFKVLSSGPLTRRVQVAAA
jgi:heme A synthase